MASSSNTLMMARVESIHSTEMITEDMKILQSLNLKLQVKVHNLESENDRLKKENQGYKGKTSVYDSLTKDLSSLRKQFDQTAAALLKKCDAYENLKKEVAALKLKVTKSPGGAVTPIRAKPQKLIPVAHHLKSTLALYRNPEDMDVSTDDETAFHARRSHGRPSMGSCGSIANQIAAEEGMPSTLKGYGGPPAPLRNRLLTKLHSIKSASTESLESTGRKSIRNQEELERSKPKKPTTTAPIPVKKPRTNLITPQTSKVVSGSAKSAPAPAYRPALGQSNGQRMVKMAISAVKRSNSSCSNKSASSKPVFRF